jgi:hypothetical protein
MEESEKKIFKPKFLVQECNGLFQYILQALLQLSLQMEITGTTQDQMLVECRTILETLPLTHWELGLKKARIKQGIFI